MRSYLHVIRKEGAVSTLSFYQDAFNLEELESLSTPLLSWLLHNRKQLPAITEIKKMIQRDEERKKTVCGYDIISDIEVSENLELENIFSEALEIVQQYFPEMYKIITIINPRVSFPLEGKTYESASHPHSFGQIFYRMDSSSPTKWAEILVHEIAHHYVEAMTVSIKEIKELREIFIVEKDSAIRKEKRPLIGIFHGVIAQASILHLATNILEDTVDYQMKDGAKAMLNRFGESFIKDKVTIESSGLSHFHDSSWGFVLNTSDRITSHGVLCG